MKMNLKMSSAKWRPLCLRLNVLILYFITEQVNHHENSTNKWQDSPYITLKRRFKNTYKLLNLGALTFSPVNKIHIFQCMGEIFCVEFQRYPFKFHKISYPCIERYDFYTKRFFEPPPPPPPPILHGILTSGEGTQYLCHDAEPILTLLRSVGDATVGCDVRIHRSR